MKTLSEADVQDAVESLLVPIDRITGPDRMDKKSALNVLEAMVDHLQMRIECLQDEITAEKPS